MITGIVDEEEMGGGQRKLRRKSMARSSVENVLTVLSHKGLKTRDYDLHINFPSGSPVDGPSAGIAMATAIYSAIKDEPVNPYLAMTGEISIRGHVKPVGGIVAKVKAAQYAGVKKVIIPRENWQEIFNDLDGIQVIPVDRFQEVIDLALVKTEEVMSEILPLEQPVLLAGDHLNPSPSLNMGALD